MAIRERVPWWARIGAKLLLSRLPVSHRTWRRLDLFQHGAMDDLGVALRTFRFHYERVNPIRPLAPGFTMLELGPGDGLLSGLCARAYGAGRSWLVDTGAYADSDPERFRAAAERAIAEGLALEPPPPRASFEALLAHYRIGYLTEGLASLRTLPDASLDLSWSQAVLEHVRRHELPAIAGELRRLTRPGGVGSHVIDLADHLGGGLDNLRLPERVWEHEAMARAGFYTNRLQAQDYIRLFERAGYACRVACERRWERLPTPRRALAEPFRNLSDEALLVRELELVLLA